MSRYDPCAWCGHARALHHDGEVGALAIAPGRCRDVFAKGVFRKGIAVMSSEGRCHCPSFMEATEAA